MLRLTCRHLALLLNILAIIQVQAQSPPRSNDPPWKPPATYQTQQETSSDFAKFFGDKFEVPLSRLKNVYLAGFDTEIYKLRDDLARESVRDEILVTFYLWTSHGFKFISTLHSDYETLKRNINKYHHYFQLKKVYIERFTKKREWRIDKLIMLPSTFTDDIVFQKFGHPGEFVAAVEDPSTVILPKEYGENYPDADNQSILGLKSKDVENNVLLDIYKEIVGQKNTKTEIEDANNESLTSDYNDSARDTTQSPEGLYYQLENPKTNDSIYASAVTPKRFDEYDGQIFQNRKASSTIRDAEIQTKEENISPGWYREYATQINPYLAKDIRETDYLTIQNESNVKPKVIEISADIRPYSCYETNGNKIMSIDQYNNVNPKKISPGWYSEYAIQTNPFLAKDVQRTHCLIIQNESNIKPKVIEISAHIRPYSYYETNGGKSMLIDQYNNVDPEKISLGWYSEYATQINTYLANIENTIKYTDIQPENKVSKIQTKYNPAAVDQIKYVGSTLEPINNIQIKNKKTIQSEIEVHYSPNQEKYIEYSPIQVKYITTAENPTEYNQFSSKYSPMATPVNQIEYSPIIEKSVISSQIQKENDIKYYETEPHNLEKYSRDYSQIPSNFIQTTEKAIVHSKTQKENPVKLNDIEVTNTPIAVSQIKYDQDQRIFNSIAINQKEYDQTIHKPTTYSIPEIDNSIKYDEVEAQKLNPGQHNVMQAKHNFAKENPLRYSEIKSTNYPTMRYSQIQSQKPIEYSQIQSRASFKYIEGQTQPQKPIEHDQIHIQRSVEFDPGQSQTPIEYVKIQTQNPIEYSKIQYPKPNLRQIPVTFSYISSQLPIAYSQQKPVEYNQIQGRNSRGLQKIQLITNIGIQTVKPVGYTGIKPVKPEGYTGIATLKPVGHYGMESVYRIGYTGIEIVKPINYSGIKTDKLEKYTGIYAENPVEYGSFLTKIFTPLSKLQVHNPTEYTTVKAGETNQYNLKAADNLIEYSQAPSKLDEHKQAEEISIINSENQYENSIEYPHILEELVKNNQPQFKRAENVIEYKYEPYKLDECFETLRKSIDYDEIQSKKNIKYHQITENSNSEYGPMVENYIGYSHPQIKNVGNLIEYTQGTENLIRSIVPAQIQPVKYNKIQVLNPNEYSQKSINNIHESIDNTQHNTDDQLDENHIKKIQSIMYSNPIQYKQVADKVATNSKLEYTGVTPIEYSQVIGKPIKALQHIENLKYMQPSVIKSVYNNNICKYIQPIVKTVEFNQSALKAIVYSRPATKQVDYNQQERKSNAYRGQTQFTDYSYVAEIPIIYTPPAAQAVEYNQQIPKPFEHSEQATPTENSQLTVSPCLYNQFSVKPVENIHVQDNLVKYIHPDLKIVENGKQTDISIEVSHITEKPIINTQPTLKAVKYFQPIEKVIKHNQPVQNPIENEVKKYIWYPRPTPKAQPTSKFIEYSQQVSKPTEHGESAVKPVDYSQPILKRTEYRYVAENPTEYSQPVPKSVEYSQKNIEKAIEYKQLEENPIEYRYVTEKPTLYTLPAPKAGKFMEYFKPIEQVVEHRGSYVGNTPIVDAQLASMYYVQPTSKSVEYSQPIKKAIEYSYERNTPIVFKQPAAKPVGYNQRAVNPIEFNQPTLKIIDNNIQVSKLIMHNRPVVRTIEYDTVKEKQIEYSLPVTKADVKIQHVGKSIEYRQQVETPIKCSHSVEKPLEYSHVYIDPVLKAVEYNEHIIKSIDFSQPPPKSVEYIQPTKLVKYNQPQSKSFKYSRQKENPTECSYREDKHIMYPQPSTTTEEHTQPTTIPVGYSKPAATSIVYGQQVENPTEYNHIAEISTLYTQPTEKSIEYNQPTENSVEISRIENQIEYNYREEKPIVYSQPAAEPVVCNQQEVNPIEYNQLSVQSAEYSQPTAKPIVSNQQQKKPFEYNKESAKFSQITEQPIYDSKMTGKQIKHSTTTENPVQYIYTLDSYQAYKPNKYGPISQNPIHLNGATTLYYNQILPEKTFKSDKLPLKKAENIIEYDDEAKKPEEFIQSANMIKHNKDLCNTTEKQLLNSIAVGGGIYLNGIYKQCKENTYDNYHLPNYLTIDNRKGVSYTDFSLPEAKKTFDSKIISYSNVPITYAGKNLWYDAMSLKLPENKQNLVSYSNFSKPYFSTPKLETSANIEITSPSLGVVPSFSTGVSNFISNTNTIPYTKSKMTKSKNVLLNYKPILISSKVYPNLYSKKAQVDFTKPKYYYLPKEDFISSEDNVDYIGHQRDTADMDKIYDTMSINVIKPATNFNKNICNQHPWNYIYTNNFRPVRKYEVLNNFDQTQNNQYTPMINEIGYTQPTYNISPFPITSSAKSDSQNQANVNRQNHNFFTVSNFDSILPVTKKRKSKQQTYNRHGNYIPYINKFEFADLNNNVGKINIDINFMKRKPHEKHEFHPPVICNDQVPIKIKQHHQIYKPNKLKEIQQIYNSVNSVPRILNTKRNNIPRSNIYSSTGLCSYNYKTIAAQPCANTKLSPQSLPLTEELGPNIDSKSTPSNINPPIFDQSITYSPITSYPVCNSFNSFYRKMPESFKSYNPMRYEYVSQEKPFLSNPQYYSRPPSIPYTSGRPKISYSAPTIQGSTPINSGSKNIVADSTAYEFKTNEKSSLDLYSETPTYTPSSFSYPSSISATLNPNVELLTNNIISSINNWLKTNPSVTKSIPVGEFGLATFNKDFNDFNVLRTDDPNIIIKTWSGKVKVVRAKLMLEAEEVSVTNFLPEIIKGDYDAKLVQSKVKEEIKKKYGEPIVVKAASFNEPYVRVSNNDVSLISGRCTILWPTFDRKLNCWMT